MNENSENIKSVDITDTMRTAYLEYAMSVIIGRALPDVRDGLKPVHRRILYAMNNLNLSHGRPFVKSARVVGDVVAKYHPHGDTAIYDSLVRLAQDFSMRYQLVEGQGNFGSVDGDEAAAMRYTEVRMQKVTDYLMDDLEKDTVDFQANYDNSLNEPLVFPTKLPVLLMNGSSGIAVGMATNIPPHNLSELIDGILYLIENRQNHSFEELNKLIPGPDFPTKGIILGRKGINSAYKTGRGVIKVRGLAAIEEIKKRQAIVITELPYGVNKSRLVETIARLTEEKKISVHDIRDETDRTGMRIVVELKKDDLPEAVLNNLYNHTQLQTSFGINMLAVINKQPKVLNLSSILLHFIDHRIEVITRRTRFELRKALDRLHIVEGLLKALQHIDDIIKTIKASYDTKTAEAELIKQFELSTEQAKAILELRLQRLTSLEQGKLTDEQIQLNTAITEFRAILDDKYKLLDIIKTELQEIKNLFGDKRRTQIVEEIADITEADLITPETNVVILSREGYIKRTVLSEYQNQNRGGKGKISIVTKSEDVVQKILVGSTHDSILLFSNLGKVFWKTIYELPEHNRNAKGKALVNILKLEKEEVIVSLTKISSKIESNDSRYLIMTTKKGVIKKTKLSEYQTQRTAGTKAINLDKGDSLVNVCLTEFDSTDQLVFIATRLGMLNLFEVKSLREQGRVTRGSRGIRLKTINSKLDYVVSMQLVSRQNDILTVSEKGFGKRTKVENYTIGRRANMGTINMRVTKRTGEVAGVLGCLKSDEVILISDNGILIRLLVNQISQIGRITQGVKLIDLAQEGKVASVSLVEEIDQEILDS